MYITLTTRCNMRCAHCCMSCTTKGRDMSFDTFKAAVALDEESVSLGGGEPTLHPEFWQFLGYSLGHCYDVWLATNGKIKDTALSLARLAKRGVISCALSQDAWHEPIDPAVVEAFRRPLDLSDGRNDSREIRNVGAHGNRPFAAGRAAGWGKEGCACEGPMVRVDGSVTQCGCAKAPVIGSVFDGFEALQDGHGDTMCCYKRVKKEQALVLPVCVGSVKL